MSAPPPVLPPKPEELTKKKIVSAALWVSLMVLVARSSGAIQSVFVSRTFTKAEVGILSILLLLNAGIESFTQTGHNTALVQRREEGLDRAINTAWLVAIGRGVLLCTIMCVMAPLVADFYGHPVLTNFIRGTALYLLIVGFQSMQMVRFEREMQFSRPKIVDVASTLCGLIVTVGVGLWLRTLWCVIAGGITSRVVRVTLTHLLAPERTTIEFNTQDFKELFHYGKSIQVVSILVFLVTQMDDAIIGKVISLEALAVYANAYVLARLPMTQVVGIASQVAFPAWSKVAREGTSQERNRMFLSTLRLTGALTIALSIALYIGGADLIELIFGQKWREAQAPLRVLIWFGLWVGLSSNFGALFNSMGRPNLIAREIVLKFTIIMLLIYPLTLHYGIVGTAIAVTAPMCAITPIACWVYLGIAQIDRRAALGTIAMPAAAAAAIFFTWWQLDPFIQATFSSVLLRGLGIPLLALILCMLPSITLDSKFRALFERAKS